MKSKLVGQCWIFYAMWIFYATVYQMNVLLVKTFEYASTIKILQAIVTTIETGLLRENDNTVVFGAKIII